jgi:hypothetical protein
MVAGMITVRYCVPDFLSREAGNKVDQITSLDKFRVPIGNQEIELQQIDYSAGGVPFLRVRIREKTRFTIFDIDPVTAERWAKGMLEWAQKSQEAK